MSACAWMMCLVLVAQVNSGSGRYPAPGSTNPFGQGSSTSGTPGTTSGTGLVPVVEPALQGVGATPGSTTPIGRAADPYGTPSSPLGGTYPPPGVGGATTPASTSPWQVNPAGSAATQGDANGGMKPAAMMRAMLLVAPNGARLPGTPISLADAVASASPRADQSERVEAYWDLCSSVADYYLGVREQGELTGARGSRTGTTWQQAEKELAARVATSQAAAVASQYRLASLMGMGGSMPLPADIPHCGDYHTRYEQIFAGRPTAEAQQLAALLPKRYSELRDAGAAVTRAQDWLNSTSARDSSDGVETVRALELLALRRRAFVQIARDYNRRIARYTELSTPGQVASERLVGMLIKSSGSATATRTSAPAPYGRQSQNAPSLPRTFDEGWAPASGEKVGDAALDKAIRPASGEAAATADGLRSLLKKPQQ